MTDINSLDAETRCVALVGKFLQKWAAMEAAMCTAIQTALSLDHYQTAIVTSNTGLRDKINILRTLVSLLRERSSNLIKRLRRSVKPPVIAT